MKLANQANKTSLPGHKQICCFLILLALILIDPTVYLYLFMEGDNFYYAFKDYFSKTPVACYYYF